jgi:hypothetical protein
MQVGIHATVIPLGREISAARSAGTCGVRQYCVTLEKQQYVHRCYCHAFVRGVIHFFEFCVVFYNN